MKFEMAFLFAYSMREGTHAHRNLQDDVSEEVKQRRVQQMIETFSEVQAPLNQAEVGKLHLLLVEGRAKREQGVLMGKTDNYKNGYAAVQTVPLYDKGQVVGRREFAIGDYLVVRVNRAGPRALYCIPLAIVATLNEYYHNLPLFEQLALPSTQPFH
jgi:tRNA A37 methylthiotransferase MiaB